MNEITISRKAAVDLCGGDAQHRKNITRNMKTKDLEDLLNKTMLTQDSPYRFKVKGD